MTKVRTILVPIDFSAGSVAAARHARELAAVFGSNVHLLHVTAVPNVPLGAVEPCWGELRAFQEPIRLSALDRLATFIALEQFDPFSTTGLVRTGCAEQVISEYADEIHADLIVMGTHGDHSEPVGTVVKRVIGRVDCPVMAIPNRSAEVVHFERVPAAREWVAC
jgi:nucleotide-binding universal stress UspA family protein